MIKILLSQYFQVWCQLPNRISCRCHRASHYRKLSWWRLRKHLRHFRSFSRKSQRKSICSSSQRQRLPHMWPIYLILDLFCCQWVLCAWPGTHARVSPPSTSLDWRKSLSAWYRRRGARKWPRDSTSARCFGNSPARRCPKSTASLYCTGCQWQPSASRTRFQLSRRARDWNFARWTVGANYFCRQKSRPLWYIWRRIHRLVMMTPLFVYINIVIII